MDILKDWENEHPGVWNVGIANYDRNGEYLGYKLSPCVVELY